MRTKEILFLLAMGLMGQVMAQDACGTTAADDAMIKAQLLENRARVSAAELAQARASRAIKYIPVTFHLVGNGSGADFPSPMGALFALCSMNRDFAVQDIQFYFGPNQPIRYMANQTVYADGYSQNSMNIMGNSKQSGTMNIYIGNAVSQPVAGYYSPGRDFVFIRRGEANLVSRTLTHEAGHFYTLPHTFYGWENLNYDDTYNGAPAPQTVNGGNPVEYKTRTGANANCGTEGDAFCDTEADYYSFRVSCNHNTVVLDPDGERLTPSNRNYMSYFDDSCMDTFTQEQRDAILASLVQRGWMNFATPNLDTVTSEMVAAIMPLDSAELQYSGSALVNFQWAAQTSAIGYIITLERMLLGQPIGTIFTQVVYGTGYSTPMGGLALGDYRWTVVPFGRHRACDALPRQFSFKLSNTGAVAVEEIAGGGLDLFIAPNPVSKGQALQFNIPMAASAEGVAELYSVDGRRVWGQRLELEAGDNSFSLSTGELATGVYVLAVRTDYGRAVQRVILE